MRRVKILAGSPGSVRAAQPGCAANTSSFVRLKGTMTEDAEWADRDHFDAWPLSAALR
jgi:hypothetical protein